MNDLMPVVAGAVSSAIFAASALPMLVKAFRTKDLKSYSLPNIALSNVGNVVHSVYVYSLPRPDLGAAQLLPDHDGTDAAVVPAVRALGFERYRRGRYEQTRRQTERTPSRTQPPDLRRET